MVPMAYQPIVDLYETYAAEILSRQEQAWREPVPEAFHQLRVFVKRARALFSLIASIAPEFEQKPFRKAFRDVFQAAGAVRDLHVQAEIVEKVEARLKISVPFWDTELGRQENDALTKFLTGGARITGDEVEATHRAIVKALRKHEAAGLAGEAYRHFWQKFGETLAFDTRTGNLHDLRKRAKESSNLTWILDTLFPQFTIDLILKDRLDRLQNQLGKWHDYDVAVQMAEKFDAASLDESSAAQWQHFIAELKKHRTLLRGRVLRSWKRLPEFSIGGTATAANA